MLNYLADKISARLSPVQMARLYAATPKWMAESLSLHRFRQTVRWAGKHSRFYREAFAQRGIDPARVRKPQDLGDFFTTPDDITSRPADFICRPPNIVFESSGTSGNNKQVYFTEDEMRMGGKTTAGGMRLAGISPEDRIANAFDFSIWIPGLMCHYGLMAAGNFCMAFGKVDPVEVYRRLEQYRFNVVFGEPTWLIRLTELAERDGGGKLKFLFGGAEEMPVDAIEWMQRVWGGARVKMCYGTVEQGTTIGFQPCDNHGGYHLDTFDFLPEIVDYDAEGFGELVFTTLMRRAMPLIRYRTRDVTRWIEHCPCGLSAPKIEKLRGRRDELIVASGGNLYPRMFENILRPIPGLESDFQIVFKLSGVREILEINVESNREDVDQLMAEIKAQASDQYPDLMKNLALGIFQMTLRVHPCGSLRAGGRKLRRMIDQRHFHPTYAGAAAPEMPLASVPAAAPEQFAHP